VAIDLSSNQELEPFRSLTYDDLTIIMAHLKRSYFRIKKLRSAVFGKWVPETWAERLTWQPAVFPGDHSYADKTKSKRKDVEFAIALLIRYDASFHHKFSFNGYQHEYWLGNEKHTIYRERRKKS